MAQAVREVGEGTATPKMIKVAENSHVLLLEAQRVPNMVPNTPQSIYLCNGDSQLRMNMFISSRDCLKMHSAVQKEYVNPCPYDLLQHRERQGSGQLNLHTLCVPPRDDPSLTLCPTFSDAVPGDRDTPATQSQLTTSAIFPSSDEANH